MFNFLFFVFINKIAHSMIDLTLKTLSERKGLTINQKQNKHTHTHTRSIYSQQCARVFVYGKYRQKKKVNKNNQKTQNDKIIKLIITTKIK